MKRGKYVSIIRYILIKNKITVFLIVFFTLLSLGFQFPMPLLSKYVFDNVIIPGKSELMRVVIMLFSIYLIGRLISVYFKNKLLLNFKSRTSCNLRIRIFESLLLSRIKSMEVYQSGYLAERLHQDSDEVSRFLGDSVTTLIESILLFAGGAILSWKISHKLALISYMMLPLYAISIKVWGKRLYEQQQNFRDTRSRSYNSASAYLKNITYIKSLPFPQELIKMFEKYSLLLLKSERSVLNTSLLASLTVQTIGFISPVIILIYGAYEVINSRLTVGGLIAFNSFLGYMFNPVKNFVNINLLYQKGKASLDKILEFVSLPVEESDLDEISESKIQNFDILFNNVSFSHYGHEENKIVFSNLNLYIPHGSFTVIKGRSGGGKTTLFKLLLRIYDPEYGGVLIGNKDIKTIPLQTLRNMIGYVPQHPVLLPETIADNLKIINPHVPIDRLNKVLRLACCEFVFGLERGIYTKINEITMNFSGGELVRINLAMALLKNPKILLLDETLAHFDFDTKLCVLNNILLLIVRNNTTVLLITHEDIGDLLKSLLVKDEFKQIHLVNIDLDKLMQQGIYKK